jgi:inorganic pyrophosphatase
MPSLLELPATPEPGVIHVVVESPRGATSKIKFDETLEVFTLSRPLPLGIAYPHDWGFVPGTRAADGDPVDALLWSEGTSYPGLVVRAIPVALIKLEQNRKSGRGRERNDRILAVPENAPRNRLRAVRDLPDRVRDELERFFIDATYFEKKAPRVLGWEGAAQALALVDRSRPHASRGAGGARRRRRR